METTLKDTSPTWSLEPHEKIYVFVLAQLGFRFAGLMRRGLGHRCTFWRGSAPPEAFRCQRSQLRAFTLRQLRSLEP